MCLIARLPPKPSLIGLALEEVVSNAFSEFFGMEACTGRGVRGGRGRGEEKRVGDGVRRVRGKEWRRKE